jgi:hypothetical protein
MAFCNSCGASLAGDARACPQCGTAVPVTTKVPVAAGPAATTPPPAPPQGANVVKIVLIALAVVIGLGILGTVAATWVGLTIARRTHITESNGKVRVQSPFGTVETNQDSDEAVRSLGIQIYPGAHSVGGNSANVQMAGMHTVAANFESDDPPQKVADFYRKQLPNANVNVSSGDHYTLVETKGDNVTTVNVVPQDGKTMINIASVTGKGIHAGQPSD